MSKPLPLTRWLRSICCVSMIEPDAVRRAVVIIDRRFNFGEVTDGPYTVYGKMIPGAGWISGGPGYRRWYAKDHVFVDTSAQVSWRGYTMGQARFELPRIARSRLLVGAQARWQDFKQVDFFGEGPQSLSSNRSQYRIQSQIFGGYATVHPIRTLAIDGQIGWLHPSILSPGGVFQRGFPATSEIFSSNLVFAQNEQPTFFHREASVTLDTRDFQGHPTAGGVYRAAFADYDDRHAGVFNFQRYEVEAARFARLTGTRAVLALHGWLVGSSTADGQSVPFYLQPSLGGQNSLRGYTDYRFHDRNLLLVNAEARVPMMTHVDAAAFVDLGNVAPRLGDLDLTKTSYGVGLRLHTRRQTFARVDLATGGEGWRLMVRLSDPLDLSRLSRQTATAPFVP
jgi:outer membrane protein assembly factor BamA